MKKAIVATIAGLVISLTAATPVKAFMPAVGVTITLILMGLGFTAATVNELKNRGVDNIEIYRPTLYKFIGELKYGYKIDDWFTMAAVSKKLDHVERVLKIKLSEEYVRQLTNQIPTKYNKLESKEKRYLALALQVMDILEAYKSNFDSVYSIGVKIFAIECAKLDLDEQESMSCRESVEVK